MTDLLRPVLELSVVIPGLLLSYFPVKSYLKQRPVRLTAWLLPLILGLCIGGGLLCRYLYVSTTPVLACITLAVLVLYVKTLRISLWKSGSIALSACAVFACINSLSRAVNAALLLHTPTAAEEPGFCLPACIFCCSQSWIFIRPHTWYEI